MKTAAPVVSPSRFTRYAAASAAALGAAAAAEAQFTGSYSLESPAANTFTNPASPSTFGQWTFTKTSGGASTVITSTGASLDLTIDTGASGNTAYFDFTAVAAETGNVTFDYSSVLTAGSFPSPGAGNFRYVVNTPSTSIATSTTSGTFYTFAVNKDDVFGFRVVAGYAYNTTMHVTITNFSAPTAIPEAGATSLLAGVASLGFVGLLAGRKLRERAAAPAAS